MPRHHSVSDLIRDKMIRLCLVSKNFQDSPSHRIFEYIHGALNVVLKNNQLHSIAVNDEINFLSLISP